MHNYDIVISASCYYSPDHAIRLVRSTRVLKGDILTIITCPRMEDANVVAAGVYDLSKDVVILHSQRAERHLCQDLAFVWCLANNIKGRYLAFTDDDIEFRGADILACLDDAPLFSVLGIGSNTSPYGVHPFEGLYNYGAYCFSPCWVDGHNIFTKWEDNLKFGVMDACPGSYNASSVEVEYAHRLTLLTGHPTVGCMYRAIAHHSRVDGMEKVRDEVNKQSVIHEGYRLWLKKFGLALSAGPFNDGSFGWPDVAKTLAQPEYAQKYQQHIIFDGLWVDWDAIWNKYREGISIIYSNKDVIWKQE